MRPRRPHHLPAPSHFPHPPAPSRPRVKFRARVQRACLPLSRIRVRVLLCVALSVYWLRLQAPCSPHARSPCSSFSTLRSSRSPSRDVVSSRSPQLSLATWPQPFITLCCLRLRFLVAPSPCASAEASRGTRFHRFPLIQREWFRLQARPRWCGRRAFGTWRVRQQAHTATRVIHNSQLSCV